MAIQVDTDRGRKTCAAGPGQTLLDALRQVVQLQAPCGGNGSCGKCRVILVEPEGERTVLACQTPARDGMVVRLPRHNSLQVALEGEAHTDLAPDPGLTGLGVACDIGTTTVVCRLVELSTGEALGVLGQGNAQCSFGADVISRIKAAMEGQLPQLTHAIREQLAGMILELCRQAGIGPEHISAMAVAGNTTMCHLLSGLDPAGLGAAPFTPLSRFGEPVPARDLELPFDGPVYLCPAVSGYVGGDITADLLAAGMDRMDRPALLIDVGTNGEMALGCGEHFVCCSTAAGPAFEGAQLSCGMTAAPGAVSAVEWADGTLACTVLGGGIAAGICGSGLLDAVAVMLGLGAVDETGRMLDPEEDELPEQAAPYLFLTEEGQPAFRLAPQVYITQGDVRKLQLGKGAIAAGVQVLLDAYGIQPGQVGRLLLAGGFGSYLRPESAARIGLIPAELLPVTQAVGNCAAQGARLALISGQARQRLARLQQAMSYLELSGLPAFNSAYLDAMMFPEQED